MDAPRSALGRRSGARKRSAGARPPPWSAGRLVTPAFPIRHSREGENPRTIGTHRDDTRDTTNHVRTETPVNPPQTCPDPRYGAGVLEWGEENVARSKTTRGEGLVPGRGQPAGPNPRKNSPNDIIWEQKFALRMGARPNRDPRSPAKTKKCKTKSGHASISFAVRPARSSPTRPHQARTDPPEKT